MREIKFRGKDICGNWFYGGFTRFGKRKTPCIDFYDAEEHAQGYIPVDLKTVGEFTGFKDIDSTEIFEGDIVENEEGERRLVYKVAGGYALGEPPIVEKAELYDCFFTDIIPSYLKVVGNKFDNPDILEAQHERN